MRLRWRKADPLDELVAASRAIVSDDRLVVDESSMSPTEFADALRRNSIH